VSPALDLGELDRFTVGTQGAVGRRVFLLQCRTGATLLTLKVEKQQVAVLAGLCQSLCASDVRAFFDRPCVGARLAMRSVLGRSGQPPIDASVCIPWLEASQIRG